MIASYDPNKAMKLVRNPHFKEWSDDAQPDGYPDEIHYDFGLTEEAAGHRRRQRPGRLDVRPAADRPARPRSARNIKKQVYVTPLTAMWYAPMNTRLAPFDNVKARQAVAYAIDRKALVNLFGGPVLASPVCQVLPPGFPGHERLLPLHQGSRRQVDGARPGEGQAAGRRNPAPTGQKVTIIAQDLTVDRNRRRLPAERAQRPRLQGRASRRSRRTSSSPTSRTPTTRCRSASRSGTRTIRRRRTS